MYSIEKVSTVYLAQVKKAYAEIVASQTGTIKTSDPEEPQTASSAASK